MLWTFADENEEAPEDEAGGGKLGACGIVGDFLARGARPILLLWTYNAASAYVQPDLH